MGWGRGNAEKNPVLDEYAALGESATLGETAALRADALVASDRFLSRIPAPQSMAHGRRAQPVRATGAGAGTQSYRIR
jgi:hypothetical protein